MWRLQVVLGHLKGQPDSDALPALRAVRCLGAAPQASAGDVVVVHGRRTAIGRGGRGGFKDTTPDELLSAVMTAVLQDLKLRPAELGDICVGESATLGLASAASPFLNALLSHSAHPCFHGGEHRECTVRFH